MKRHAICTLRPVQMACFYLQAEVRGVPLCRTCEKSLPGEILLSREGYLETDPSPDGLGTQTFTQLPTLAPSSTVQVSVYST